MKQTIRLKRIGAFLLDGLFVAIFTSVITTILAVFDIGTITENPTEAQFNKAYLVSMLAAVLVAFAYYTIVPMFNEGATFGKKICSITVYNDDGSKVKNFRLFVRNVAFFSSLCLTLGFLNSPKYMYYMYITDPNNIDQNYLMTLVTPLTSLFMLIASAITIVTAITVLTSGGFKAINDIIAKTRVDHINPEQFTTKTILVTETKEEKKDDDRPDLSHFGTNNPPQEEE